MDTFPSPPQPPPPASPFANVVPTPPPAPKTSGGKCALLGCGGCLGLVIIGVISSTLIFLFTMNIIRKTDVYSEALKRVQNSAEVQQALGTPIENGWTFNGSVNYNNGEGKASFTVPITGPKGKGTLRVTAEKNASTEWQYSTLEVELADGRKIDVRPDLTSNAERR